MHKSCAEGPLFDYLAARLFWDMFRWLGTGCISGVLGCFSAFSNLVEREAALRLRDDVAGKGAGSAAAPQNAQRSPEDRKGVLCWPWASGISGMAFEKFGLSHVKRNVKFYDPSRRPVPQEGQTSN